jgi:polyisoprenyl-phosphate glycosyltransferase
MPRISVVLSFYNEAAVLDEFIERLEASLKTVQGIEYELVFVNDASTDGSRKLLEHRARTNRAIRVLNLSRNFGSRRIGNCTIAGFAHATGDAILTMDCDLQDPPELVPTLIEAWRADPSVDVVYTVRSVRRGETRGKLMLTRVGYALLRWLSEIDLPQASGDFRLISRRVASHVVALRERRAFLRGMVRWVGFKQVAVTYERDARAGGDTHFPVLSARVIDNFLYGLLSYTDVPLKAIFYLGLLGVPLSAAWIVGAVAWAIGPGEVGVVLAPWITFLAATTWFALGILALHMNQVLEQVRERPLYIVESKIGFDGQDEERAAGALQSDAEPSEPRFK